MKRFYIFVLALLALIGCDNRTEAEKILGYQSDPMSNEVLIIAHRGDWRSAPENSLHAYQSCIDAGYDMVEVDVRKTSDGVLVVMHDETVNRTTEGAGKVSEMTAAQITSLRLRNACGRVTEYDEYVPTFEQVLALCKDKVVIHLDKGYELFREVYELTEKHGMTEQVMFKTSVHPSRLKQDYPDLLGKIPYVPVLGVGGANSSAVIKESLELKPLAIECVIGRETPELKENLQLMKSAGVKICIGSMWGSACAGHDDDRAVKDADAAWGWILEQGATQIMTDRPYELLKYLQEKKLHR